MVVGTTKFGAAGRSVVGQNDERVEYLSLDEVGPGFRLVFFGESYLELFSETRITSRNFCFAHWNRPDQDRRDFAILISTSSAVYTRPHPVPRPDEMTGVIVHNKGFDERYLPDLIKSALRSILVNIDRMNIYDAGNRVDVSMSVANTCVPYVYLLICLLSQRSAKYFSGLGIDKRLYLDYAQKASLDVIRVAINSCLSTYYVFDETKGIRSNLENVILEDEVVEFNNLAMSARVAGAVLSRTPREVRLINKYRKELQEKITELKEVLQMISAIKFLRDESLRRSGVDG